MDPGEFTQSLEDDLETANERLDKLTQQLKDTFKAYKLVEDAALELAPWAPDSVKARVVNRMNSAAKLIGGDGG